MAERDYLSVLNPEQYEAVTHTGSPLLILAGAGSGKTRVITTKIAYLIEEHNIEPWKILAVTFTKKAATEMKERAEKLCERAVKSQIKTFHSFGAWLLRLYADFARISPNFTVYDDDDMVALLSKVAPQLSKQQASIVAHKIALAKDYCYTPENPDLCKIESDAEFRHIYELYEKRLRETGNVDFGDLIMLPVLMMETNPDVRTHIQNQFKVIMVDEYQDSNVAQFRFLKNLVGEKTYLCVVGDDDQSIYKFRGADITNILDFQKDFENTKIIKLVKNYRSTSEILKCADDVVKNNKARLGKTLEAVRGKGKKPILAFVPSGEDEANFCAELVTQSYKKGAKYSDWAILYRTNAQSLSFEKVFNQRKIPYTIVGSLKFFEREEIKDLISFCKFIINPFDELAFERIINKPSRGVGKVTVTKIIDYGKELKKNSLLETEGILEACFTMKGLSKKAQEGVNFFANLIKELKDILISNQNIETPMENLANKVLDFETILNQETLEQEKFVAENNAENTLASLLEIIIKKSGLAEHYASVDEITGTQKVLNMQELLTLARDFPNSMVGLERFLDQIELDRSLETENTENESNDVVTLITLHNTKGLEFPRVVITGMEHGIFPRKEKTADEIEEERRLFYVGITRAMDQLYLTNAKIRVMYGRLEAMEISPFLTEINPANLEVLGNQPPSYKRYFSGKPPVNEELFNHPLGKRWKKEAFVYHDDYGTGQIINAFITEDDEYCITVQFETGEKKKFLPKYQQNHLTLVIE